MDLLLSLWLPILLSATAVWFVSLIASVVLPHHKQDFIAIPPELGGEDGFIDDLRKRGGAIKPGNYLFPDFRGREAMNSPKVQKSLNEGPSGHLVIWKAPLTMADKMVGTFIVYLVATALIAYLASIVLTTPAPFARVFQVVATAGVLTYCFSFIPSALWWGSYKRTIVANVIDGLVYAAITGAIFAWRWPGGALGH